MILDSIVRGTTSKEIVQMAKDVGAKKVVFASCAPPMRYVLLAFVSQTMVQIFQVLQRIRYRHALS